MKVRLNNVGVIKECEVEFNQGVTIIIGSSGSGKSTLMRSIYNMATNGFNDCDISFGKNTMKVFIDCDGNTVEYIRSIKTKGDRFYYKVNGETYSKIGRSSLQQVSDALKIGNIEINGEDVNFNFNLQFSAPFLILGSQSTLYNVLTYRSSFDISSINDYYKLDVKDNDNEINTNTKLKERLECTLNELEDKASKLSPIEKIYSDYMVCKHTSDLLDDSILINEKLNKFNFINDSLSKINICLNDVCNSIKLASEIIELTKFKDICEQYKKVKNTYSNITKLINCYNNAILYYQTINDLDNLVNILSYNKDIDRNIEIICNYNTSYNDILLKEDFIKDILKQKELLINYASYLEVTSIIEKSKNINYINILEDIIKLYNQLCIVKEVNSILNDIKYKEDMIHNKLLEFSICPLCGGELHNV